MAEEKIETPVAPESAPSIEMEPVEQFPRDLIEIDTILARRFAGMQDL